MKTCVLIALISISLFACHKNEHAVKEAIATREIVDVPAEVKIPHKLWDLIEQDPTAHKEEKKKEGGEGSEGEGDASAEKKNAVVFAPLRVTLREKNEGILQPQHIQIQYPRGGGSLDLSEYTTGETGTFFFNIEIPDLENTVIQRAFFLSQARKRKVENEIFGSGCNTFFEMGPAFFADLKLQGLKLNTARQRHISVLSGIFILTARKDNQTLVAQLNVTDSKNKYLLCEGKNESNSGQ